MTPDVAIASTKEGRAFQTALEAYEKLFAVMQWVAHTDDPTWNEQREKVCAAGEKRLDTVLRPAVNAKRQLVSLMLRRIGYSEAKANMITNQFEQDVIETWELKYYG